MLLAIVLLGPGLNSDGSSVSLVGCLDTRLNSDI